MPDHYDEAITAEGETRPAYAALLEALGRVDLGELEVAVQRRLADHDVTFGGRRGQTFHVDPIPRLIAGAEWAGLVRGMRQRSRALNAFLADVAGGRRIVAEGVVPAAAIELAEHHQPVLRGVEALGGHAPLVGFDFVRGADGVLRVLEDNLRSPSGLAYALAARAATDAAFEERPELAGLLGAEREPIDDVAELLSGALAAARPAAGPETTVLLSDGVDAGARYEHAELARRLGVAIVTPADLRRRGELLIAKIGDEETPVGVVYRRSEEELLIDPIGASNWVAELFLAPLRAGRLGIVNAFGNGVADDKLTHAYVEEMVRFYLGEEPILASVRTLDLTDPVVRAEALERIEELVIKPRAGHGGYGIVVCRHATPEDRRRIGREIELDPQAFVAQETVDLSSHPTVSPAALEPRHVDLRAFVIGDRVLAGGLTRFARERGALIVNSSQNGGAKDTWVLRGEGGE